MRDLLQCGRGSSPRKTEWLILGEVKKLRLTTKMLQSIQPKHTFAVHMQINEQPHQPWLMVSSHAASQTAPRIAAVG